MSNTFCGKSRAKLHRARAYSSFFKVGNFTAYDLGYVRSEHFEELTLFIYLMTPSRCPGFLKLKMQSTYGAPVAFVDFQVSRSPSSSQYYFSVVD